MCCQHFANSSAVVDDTFILYLFQIVEELYDDPNDPYSYHVIRVIVSSIEHSKDNL